LGKRGLRQVCAAAAVRDENRNRRQPMLDNPPLDGATMSEAARKLIAHATIIE
jgi:hypothetical protein